MHKITDYDFDLPKELIAQLPSEKRGDERLMVVERAGGKILHRKFADIAEYFSKGDCLVINNTRVIPARVFGRKKTGGLVETLFVEIKTPYKATALLKPSLQEGEKIFYEDGITAEVGKKILGADGEPTGEHEIIFNIQDSHRRVIEKYGVMPLPPYIKRKKISDPSAEIDKKRYQTIYARKEGSIAAPTAGLHWTEEILNDVKAKGCAVAEITLHVGLGTFRKVATQDIRHHRMLPEKFFIPQSEADKINKAITSRNKIFVTGTTAVRAVETAAKPISSVGKKGFLVSPFEGESSLYIYPGYNFKVTDCLITNFHLPRSTPLFLTAAFMGDRGLLLKSYNEAIKEGYRFFSYGDAMLVI